MRFLLWRKSAGVVCEASWNELRDMFHIVDRQHSNVVYNRVERNILGKIKGVQDRAFPWCSLDDVGCK